MYLGTYEGVSTGVPLCVCTKEPYTIRKTALSKTQKSPVTYLGTYEVLSTRVPLYVCPERQRRCLPCRATPDMSAFVRVCVVCVWVCG